MKEEKYLPLGTVLKLDKATKKIMIVGFCPISLEGKSYDYVGCLYPEGLDGTKNLLFNHDQIAEIINVGFADNECEKFMTTLKNVMKDEQK